ncbi:MAG: type B DNA-directed DNA polymerase [Methanomicrobiales archaeon]|nr:type B DNA-directed DNA polymerase [Methanomicrobiales archaeon]
MWILDACPRRGGVEVWGRDRCGTLVNETLPYQPSFLLHLQNPHDHWEMVDAISALHQVEECRFRTLYGEREGYRIHADRDTALAVEEQTGYGADLYDVDIRAEQRCLIPRGIDLCSYPGESRFSPDFPIPLFVMEIKVPGTPSHEAGITEMEVKGKQSIRLKGHEKEVIADFCSVFAAEDPDLVLFPSGDLWTPVLLARARACGLTLPISRSGRYRRLTEKSYWSYGRTVHRGGALIPEGRVVIDTTQSFNYREGGLTGVILASRLTGIPPNLAARFSAGTLISSYEVAMAIRSGIAVPFRKGDPESLRTFEDLRAADRGGLIFQPKPGIYPAVTQIDFTSLYPSIIVQSNLSPETVHDQWRPGFLPTILAPLLALRKETKARKKHDSRYAGSDAILKWMLVTSFGYTGFRNAKFGGIEVHEAITSRAREILLDAREIAQADGCKVLHGIIDCLWLQGGSVGDAARHVEEKTGLPLEAEAYDWIAFYPLADGTGSYTRYVGKLTSGRMRLRGVLARRHDTPHLIKETQEGLFALMAQARTPTEISALAWEVVAQYRAVWEALPSADPRDLSIRRQVSRLTYHRRCAEASAVAACTARGIPLAPGMAIEYVVTDAGRWEVVLADEATSFDLTYYRGLLTKAWEEVAFVLRSASEHRGGAPGGHGTIVPPPRLTGRGVEVSVSKGSPGSFRGYSCANRTD